MTRHAHSSSRIAVALLALAAACGTGQPGPGGMSSRTIRMQNPAELDTENGLIAVDLSCLSLNSTGPTTTQSLLDPALSGATTCDPSIDPTCTTTCDPSIDPTCTPTCDPSIDPTCGGSSVGVNSCGISMNGMPPSLLDINGLSPNSLADDHFKNWFASDPATANTVMKYLVKCSLPDGLGMDFDYGGVHYIWAGMLGLAPHWVAGEPIPENEQQLVSACLALHANRYGAHVPISILGRLADGTEIPYGDTELSDFPVTEGCFFGNAFRGEGLFSANDRPMPLTDDESSIRACAMADRTGSGAASMCPPIAYSGNCRDICQPDPNNLYYLNCTVNGKTYPALSTRIKPSAQYTCGDGICQVTESCGNGTSFNNCEADCGPCN